MAHCHAWVGQDYLQPQLPPLPASLSGVGWSIASRVYDIDERKADMTQLPPCTHHVEEQAPRQEGCDSSVSAYLGGVPEGTNEGSGNVQVVRMIPMKLTHRETSRVYGIRSVFL